VFWLYHPYELINNGGRAEALKGQNLRFSRAGYSGGRKMRLYYIHFNPMLVKLELPIANREM